MIKKIAAGVVNFFIKVFRPKSNRYLFVSFTGDYYDNLKYFSEFLNIKEHDLDIIWLYGNINKNIIHKKTYKLTSIRGLYYLITSKVIILNGWSGLFSKLNFFNRKVVQLWHGIPLRTIGEKDKSIDPETKSLILEASKKWDLLTVTSNYTIERFAQSLDINLHNISITGFPRTDIFFETKRKKKGKEYNKVILYMPTWRPFENSFDIFNMEILQYTLEQCNYKLIVKAHMNSSLCIKEYDNIDFLIQNDRDTQELLVESDILISDYSSVVVDYALLERPIIFYCYDYEEYKKKVGLYDEIKNIYTGPIAYTFEELIFSIKNIDDFNYKAVIDFKNKFHDYCDGSSSQRVYVAIQEKLKEKNV